MKIFSFFRRHRRGQSGTEYLILLGMVVGLTLWAFNALLPKIISDTTGPNVSGHAVEFFTNIYKKLVTGQAPSAGSGSPPSGGNTPGGGSLPGGGTTDPGN